MSKIEGASTTHAGGHRLGDGTVTFQVVNNTRYRLVFRQASGKITGQIPGELTKSPGDVTLTDDSAPTDQGDIYYTVLDNGQDIGRVDLTFIENWYNGPSTQVKYWNGLAAKIADTGTGTDGSKQITLFDAGCVGGYSGGILSVDMTAYNGTPYPLQLVNDPNLTNSEGGAWHASPPATIQPGGCVELSGYDSDPMVGFVLNATYAFQTPAGVRYAVFSASNKYATPDDDGFGVDSHVYSTRPQHTGGGWLGTVDWNYPILESGSSPDTAAHAHTNLVVSPSS